MQSNDKRIAAAFLGAAVSLAVVVSACGLTVTMFERWAKRV